jgi:hypothetical protein
MSDNVCLFREAQRDQSLQSSQNSSAAAQRSRHSAYLYSVSSVNNAGSTVSQRTSISSAAYQRRRHIALWTFQTNSYMRDQLHWFPMFVDHLRPRSLQKDLRTPSASGTIPTSPELFRALLP